MLKSSAWVLFAGECTDSGVFAADQGTASDPIISREALGEVCGTGPAEGKALAGLVLEKWSEL